MSPIHLFVAISAISYLKGNVCKSLRGGRGVMVRADLTLEESKEEFQQNWPLAIWNRDNDAETDDAFKD